MNLNGVGKLLILIASAMLNDRFKAGEINKTFLWLKVAERAMQSLACKKVFTFAMVGARR